MHVTKHEKDSKGSERFTEWRKELRVGGTQHRMMVRKGGPGPEKGTEASACLGLGLPRAVSVICC